MTVEYYSPGHLREVVRFLPPGFTPAWLLLGGPADADEAQTARQLWPDIGIVAAEPNPEAYRWQLDVGGWPDGAQLSSCALADHLDGVDVAVETGNLRGASAHPAATAGGGTIRVKTVTLDYLDENFGLFSDAILWLDVEGSELAALRGAAGLFARRAVALVNVEVQARRTDMNLELTRLLKAAGFRKVHRWNDSPACEDQVWVLR